MDRRILFGSVVVLVIVAAVETLVNTVLLAPFYEPVKHLFRTPEETKFGVIVITWLFFSFFFTFIFSKGYEGKGIAEGVRYGLYVALMMMVPVAYTTYATMDIPYYLALLWFLYGTIECILCGIALALVFRMKKTAASPA